MSSSMKMMRRVFVALLNLVFGGGLAWGATVTFDVVTSLDSPEAVVNVGPGAKVPYVITVKVTPGDPPDTSSFGAGVVDLLTDLGVVQAPAAEMNPMLQLLVFFLGTPADDDVFGIGGSQRVFGGGIPDLFLNEAGMMARGELNTPMVDGTYQVQLAAENATVLTLDLQGSRPADEVLLGAGFTIVVRTGDDDQPDPTKYTLDVQTVGAGTVSATPEKERYDLGEIVELEATAGAGWRFARWSGDVSSFAREIAVEITGDVSVEAVFENPAPEAVPGGPYQGVAGTEIQFDGSGSSDPLGEALTMHWEFGDNTGADGAGADGPSPTHTYGAAGTYAVTLTVTDAAGNSDSEGTIAIVSAESDGSDGSSPGAEGGEDSPSDSMADETGEESNAGGDNAGSGPPPPCGFGGASFVPATMIGMMLMGWGRSGLCRRRR